MQEQPHQEQPQLQISEDILFNTKTDTKIDNFIEEYDLIIGHLRDKYIENDYLVKFGFTKQEIESTMKVRNKLINNLMIVTLSFLGGVSYAFIRTYKLLKNNVPLRKTKGPWLLILFCISVNRLMDAYYENKIRSSFEDSLILKFFPENSILKSKELINYYKVQKMARQKLKTYF